MPPDELSLFRCGLTREQVLAWAALHEEAARVFQDMAEAIRTKNYAGIRDALDALQGLGVTQEMGRGLPPEAQS